MVEIEKIVVITQKSWLDGLVEKFNTKQQARFYIEQSGGNFSEYVDQHTTYYSVLSQLKRALPSKIRHQIVDKSFLPSFLFGPNDLVIVLGRDGLVINTAKYLNTQPILAVNPDPNSVQGVLLPFTVDDVKDQISKIIEDKSLIAPITVAEVNLNTNQGLIGVNDIFIGHQSHQSARYSITQNGFTERHSSSGIVISTGIGSTGWFKSIVTAAYQLSNRFFHGMAGEIDEEEYRVSWDTDYLHYCVREAWTSKTTGNTLVFGKIEMGDELIIESHMPEGGVIFSDGIEKDRIQFNSGSIARIKISDKKVYLYVKSQ